MLVEYGEVLIVSCANECTNTDDPPAATFLATYLNFVVINDGAVVPTYLCLNTSFPKYLLIDLLMMLFL